MKRTGTNHPKFGMLADSLGIRLYGAVGIMEMLWHFTAQHAPQGDIGKWPDVRIARFVDWPIEDSERLMRALVDCKLLDECATCRFVVHDWHEHCDDAVHMMLARSTLRFASGAIPSLSRFTKDERQKILTAFDEQAHKKRFKTHKSTQKHTENALKHTKNALPSHALPKPSHALPSQATDSAVAGCESETHDMCSPEEFLETWNRADGNVKANRLEGKRLTAFNARLKEKSWLESWRSALDKFPLKLITSDPNGWKPDIDWFLKPDSVSRIIEGKYDWSKHSHVEASLRPAFNPFGAET